MRTGSKKQRPPFQAAPEVLLPRLVDEQLSMYDLLERALWVRTLWLCQPTEGNTKGTHSGLTALLKIFTLFALFVKIYLLRSNRFVNGCRQEETPDGTGKIVESIFADESEKITIVTVKVYFTNSEVTQ